MRKTKICLMLIFVGILLTLCACGLQGQISTQTGEPFDEMTITGSMELDYATKFTVDYYGDYSLVTIADDSQFLVVPKQCEVPTNIPDNVTVLQQPLSDSYIVSSSVLDMIRQIDGLEYISFSGTKENDWYIDEIKERMQAGVLQYAGKYSAPDYELLLVNNCRLAVENTMIGHNPEVKDKLKEVGIPVLVEYSSYEEHPLGRLEWIKLYGLLYDRFEEADEYYNEQLESIDSVVNHDTQGEKLSVAFFYVTTNKAVNVRKPNDYIAKMIDLAGGSYVLDGKIDNEDNALSTMNMQIEDFYLMAKDADIIIYNSTVEGELDNVQQIIDKNDVFKDFKAVKNNNVYCTSKNFFQESTGTCGFIKDVSTVLAYTANKELMGNIGELKYLKQLQ